jgi:hypothetical protein
MDAIVLKTIKKTFNSHIKAGITWFKFISAVNDIKLTQRELELLAYINHRGTISSTSSKEDFCKMFNSSPATVTNMTAKLLKQKQKFLIKDKSKIKINPALRVDFDKDFVVRFFMELEKPKNQEDADT